MLDEIEMKLKNYCKIFPCFTCIVRSACYQGYREPPEKACDQFFTWLDKRDILWHDWEPVHGKNHRTIEYLFEIACEELKREDDNEYR